MPPNRRFIYDEKMDKRCCINKCKSELYGSGISFYRFPSRKKLQQKWLDAVPATQRLTNDSVVCSQHFKPVDLHNVGSRQMLKAHVVPSIFPVTGITMALILYNPAQIFQKQICTVHVQALSAKTIKQAAGQRRSDVQAKIIFDTDPIEPKENQHSEDTDQTSENLTPLSNWNKKELAVPEKVYRSLEMPRVQPPLDLEEVLLWAENDSADLPGNEAEKIIQLTERCAQASQKLRSLVELVRQRDQTISDLQTQLRNYAAKHRRTWNSAIDEWNLETLKREMEPNRRMFVVQRDISPVSTPPTSDI